MDEDLYLHFCNNVRMVAADAAADEVNSVKDMTEPNSNGNAIAPQLEVILRDKALGARRSYGEI